MLPPIDFNSNHNNEFHPYESDSEQQDTKETIESDCFIGTETIDSELIGNLDSMSGNLDSDGLKSTETLDSDGVIGNKKILESDKRYKDAKRNENAEQLLNRDCQELSDIEDFAVPVTSERISTSTVLKRPSNQIDTFENSKIYVKTWGCSHNNSDSEYMAGLLAEQGYQIIFESNRAMEADCWVLNSCTVKGPSQQTFVNEIKNATTKGKKVVVAGCVPQASPNDAGWKDCSVIGVQQIDKIVFAVQESLKGNVVRYLKESKRIISGKRKVKSGGAPLNLPKIRRNPFIEIIPVNTGCLNQCTYCKTKHARGDLGSYSIQEIVERVEMVLEEGVLEIWLTSGKK